MKILYFFYVNRDTGNMIFQNSFLDENIRRKVNAGIVRSSSSPELQGNTLYLQGRDREFDLTFCKSRVVPHYFNEALAIIEQINNGDINV